MDELHSLCVVGAEAAFRHRRGPRAVTSEHDHTRRTRRHACGGRVLPLLASFHSVYTPRMFRLRILMSGCALRQLKPPSAVTAARVPRRSHVCGLDMRAGTRPAAIFWLS